MLDTWSAQVVVPAALEGERLDRAVALLWECSRAEASRLITNGKVTLNGVTAQTRSQRVCINDQVRLAELPVVLSCDLLPDESVSLELLYEDEHLVVVNKPADMVVHPGSGNRTGTMLNGLLHRYPEIAQVGDPDRPGIVHRLDKGTSGVLMAARTQLAYEILTAALSRREVQRRYIALTKGWLSDDKGVIDAPIGRSPRHRTKMAVVASGREARTHYEVLARLSVGTSAKIMSEVRDATQLELHLETGRTHQIRVHLAAIGHPLVSDELYGGPTVALLNRPALHAQTLSFNHPSSGKHVSFSAPLPEDMTNLLSYCHG